MLFSSLILLRKYETFNKQTNYKNIYRIKRYFCFVFVFEEPEPLLSNPGLENILQPDAGSASQLISTIKYKCQQLLSTFNAYFSPAAISASQVSKRCNFCTGRLLSRPDDKRSVTDLIHIFQMCIICWVDLNSLSWMTYLCSGKSLKLS